MGEFVISYRGRTKIHNDILFIGTYVEYISRALKRKQVDIIDTVGYDRMKLLYKCADACHCVSMGEHLYDFQQEYNLTEGDYDMSKWYTGKSIELCSVAASPFARIVEDVTTDEDEAFEKFWELHHSWFADEFFSYWTALYRQPTGFLHHCLKLGYVDYEDLPNP